MGTPNPHQPDSAPRPAHPAAPPLSRTQEVSLPADLKTSEHLRSAGVSWLPRSSLKRVRGEPWAWA